VVATIVDDSSQTCEGAFRLHTMKRPSPFLSSSSGSDSDEENYNVSDFPSDTNFPGFGDFGNFDSYSFFPHLLLIYDAWWLRSRMVAVLILLVVMIMGALALAPAMAAVVMIIMAITITAVMRIVLWIFSWALLTQQWQQQP